MFYVYLCIVSTFVFLIQHVWGEGFLHNDYITHQYIGCHKCVNSYDCPSDSTCERVCFWQEYTRRFQGCKITCVKKYPVYHHPHGHSHKILPFVAHEADYFGPDGIHGPHGGPHGLIGAPDGHGPAVLHGGPIITDGPRFGPDANLGGPGFGPEPHLGGPDIGTHPGPHGHRYHAPRFTDIITHDQIDYYQCQNTYGCRYGETCERVCLWQEFTKRFVGCKVTCIVRDPFYDTRCQHKLLPYPGQYGSQYQGPHKSHGLQHRPEPYHPPHKPYLGPPRPLQPYIGPPRRFLPLPMPVPASPYSGPLVFTGGLPPVPHPVEIPPHFDHPFSPIRVPVRVPLRNPFPPILPQPLADPLHPAPHVDPHLPHPHLPEPLPAAPHPLPALPPPLPLPSPPLAPSPYADSLPLPAPLPPTIPTYPVPAPPPYENPPPYEDPPPYENPPSYADSLPLPAPLPPPIPLYPVPAPPPYEDPLPIVPPSPPVEYHESEFEPNYPPGEQNFGVSLDPVHPLSQPDFDDPGFGPGLEPNPYPPPDDANPYPPPDDVHPDLEYVPPNLGPDQGYFQPFKLTDGAKSALQFNQEEETTDKSSKISPTTSVSLITAQPNREEDESAPSTEYYDYGTSTSLYSEEALSRIRDETGSKEKRTNVVHEISGNLKQRDLPAVGFLVIPQGQQKTSQHHSGHGYRQCRKHDDCGYGEECCTLVQCSDSGQCFTAYECSRGCK